MDHAARAARTAMPAGPRPRQPRGARAAAMLFIGLLTAATVVVPVSAASPGASRTPAGMTRAPLRSVAADGAGRPVRLDARRAARTARGSARDATVASRRPVSFGAGRTTTVSKPAGRTLTRAQSAGGSLSAPRIPSVLPPLVVATSFTGLAEAEACDCEPPDPWIAVSPSYVVQSTNGAVRVTNRSGAPLLTISTLALFAVPADRGDADPRILWDAVHGRWVGVLATYNGDDSQDGLRLAVSESADPTAGWTVYPIETGAYFPDYPGIASSADKIVLTSDDFFGADFVGPSFFVLDWSNILAGTDLYIGGTSFNATDAGHFRPALMLTSAANIPVIFEFAGQPGYFEITGNAHTAAVANDVDLSATFSATPFTVPPAPVQPDLSTISDAVDERPTDAVYRSGQLWFVSTWDYFDGTDHWDAARYTQLMTTANNTPISFGGEVNGVGATNFFMPGVGISGNGTVFLSATETDKTSIYPRTVVAAISSGAASADYQVIESSSRAYVGDRWGDFVGIATDPGGSGSVWLAHELVDAVGAWRTSVVRLVTDGTPPTAPGAVGQASVPPATLASTIPVRITWGAASDPGSGVTGYLVARQVDGGAFDAPTLLVPGTSTVRPLVVAHSYRFRVSAVDAVGNVGPPTYGPTFRPTLYQQTSGAVYSGTWSAASSAVYSGGGVRYASTAGRSVTFTSTLARSIGIVSTKGPTRGAFKVYVDGVYKTTIFTYGTSTRYRQLVYQVNWASAGTHRVKIVVVGTGTHRRVDVDAFIVLR
jgi:hypothetical protein